MYVGQSGWGLGRPLDPQHDFLGRGKRQKRPTDRIARIPCEAARLDAEEAYWRRELRPHWNPPPGSGRP
jgi:hypothetical protein